MMSSVRNRFAFTYAEARRKFRLAADLAGAPVRVYAHPMQGPGGEEMATDVARLGDP
jgi:hypothetical protein